MKKTLILSAVILQSIFPAILPLQACTKEPDDNEGSKTVEIQGEYTLSSPDGRLEAEIVISDHIAYDLAFAGTKLLEDSAIALVLERGIAYGTNPTLKKAQTGSTDRTIDAVNYQKAQVTDKYNSLVLDFGNDFDVEFRAYDEGFAYRFIIKRKDSYRIYGERADFNFTQDFPVQAGYLPQGSGNDVWHSFYEAPYTRTTIGSLTADKSVMMPMLVDCGSAKVLLAESDVQQYPAMHLRRTGKARTLVSGAYPPYPATMTPAPGGWGIYQIAYAEHIAEAAGARSFPWRIVAVAETESGLLTNDMVYRLSEAYEGGRRAWSWAKPGMATWDYWCGQNGTRTTMDTYKTFIDLAAQYGIPYYVIDDGWYVHASGIDTPRIALAELVSYADSKNVGLWLWARACDFAPNAEALCRQYSAMGIKGFKIDVWEFSNQRIMEQMYDIAETAAKYRMMIDFHGCYMPGGLNRTFPNVMTVEGVAGTEFTNMGSRRVDLVPYNVTFPFIRQAAGPCDLTPGATRNVPYNTPYNGAAKQAEGTRCNQIALFITTYSPLGCLCDSPANYNASEDNRQMISFISKLPAVWDETRVIEGRLGESVIVARRSGNDWYIGGICGTTARTANISLSFLTAGEYSMELMQDAGDSAQEPTHFVRTEDTVTSTSSFSADMAPGGGFAARIILNNK